MQIVLWIVAVLALAMAYTQRKRVGELSDALDKLRYDGSTREADGDELKQKLEVLTKQVAQIAGGLEIDPLMVREGRLYKNVRPEAIQKDFDDGGEPYVIDVRSPQEWATGHIRGAVHLPMDALEQRLHEVRRDGVPMYVVCAAGGRSAAAAEFLSNRGYLNVFNVEGGMNAWQGEVARDG